MKLARHAQNAPGSFYVVDGQCMACCAPEAEAPDLMDHVADPYYHCYFKKQPTTPEELNQAVRACWVSCTQAVRYAGHDPAVIRQLQEMGTGETCDHPMHKS